MNFRSSGVGKFVLKHSNSHCNGELPNIFIFSTPRSGSTWTKELFSTQEGMKFINEPFNIRNTDVAKFLSTNDWKDLYTESNASRYFDYLDAIENGHKDTSFLNTFLLKANYRYKTNRIVYKVLHAFEDRMSEVQARYNAKIVYLLRHPIPVSLSRKSCPRLESLIASDYMRHFSQAQIDYTNDLNKNGTHLERLVLSWCLQNKVPLQEASSSWNIVTYEQLTLDPERVIARLCADLELGDYQSVIGNIGKASDSSNLSSKETKQVLEREGGKDRQRFLVEKWASKVDRKTEMELMGVLAKFEIDAYSFGSFIPHERLLIKD